MDNGSDKYTHSKLGTAEKKHIQGVSMFNIFNYFFYHNWLIYQLNGDVIS
jgi:hypothetical protein